ncbi:MAG TPA: 4Fe-4S dicluster domain-containing protein [Rhodocyclaceae bacterium]
MIAAAPIFEESRCTRYRYRYSGCRRCADACPHDALSLDGEGVAVEATKCRNCSLCTAACRTAALAAANLPRIELLKQAIKGKSFSFACAPSGIGADATVPCLGAIDGVILAYLAKRGIAVELRGAGHCAACEHGARGALSMVANIEARDALAGACSGEEWAALTVAEDAGQAQAQDFHSGRRHLFRRLFGKGVDEMAHAACLADPPVPVEDKAIRSGLWHVPEMRELLTIVSRRSDGMPCRVPALAGLAVADVRLGAGCSQCEACVRACPAGALQIREGNTDWRFVFLPDRCTGCGLCAEVCQPGALSLNALVDATPNADGRTLDVRNKQRCERCDRHFVTPEPRAVCPVCSDDEIAFEQIFG